MPVYATFDADGRNPSFQAPGFNCDGPQAGSVTITPAERDAWVANPDAFRWDGVRIVAIPASTPTPNPPPTVTGNQWAFALGDLGLAAAWRAGVAKSKDKDQIRTDLIARDTPLVATDPLLIRVAANAGADANGVALIDVAAVFEKALTEPT